MGPICAPISIHRVGPLCAPVTRRVGLTGTELARAQATTIRTKLLKVGGRIVVSVRRIYLSLASSYPLQFLFRQIAARLVPTTDAPLIPT